MKKLVLLFLLSSIANASDCVKLDPQHGVQFNDDGRLDDWKSASQIPGAVACIFDPANDPVHDPLHAGLPDNLDIERLCVSVDQKDFHFLYTLQTGQRFDMTAEAYIPRYPDKTPVPAISYYQILIGSPEAGKSGFRDPSFPGKLGAMYFQTLIETYYAFRYSPAAGGILPANSGVWFDVFQDYQYRWKSQSPVAGFAVGKEAVEITIPREDICNKYQSCERLSIIATSSELANKKGDDFTSPLEVCL